MSSSPAAAPAAKPEDGFDLERSVKTAEMPTARRWLKMANVINAMFLAAAGVLAFILESISLLLVLSAIYVIAFSLMLLMYELHWKSLEESIASNFGFMFSWRGRMIFFLFVGTLAFGIGKVGIAAGVFTALNLLFNMYVVYHHPELKTHYQHDAKVRQSEALSAVQQKAAISITPGQAVAIAGAAAPVLAAVAANKDAWEKLYDETSGKYYFHNPQTGETRWDV